MDRFYQEIGENLNRLGVKVLLFDLDDTLIYTGEMFIKYMNEYVEVVAQETGLPREQVDECLKRLNDEEYKAMGVNPARWGVVVSKVAMELVGHEDSVLKNLSILMKIYEETPRLRSGATAVLEILKEAGIKMALVTHANVEWTQRKLQSTGLANYFETIVIVDENKHKSEEDWLEAVDKMGVLPDECLILGDNLGGDIIPAANIGARTMWLHNGSTWSVYRTGTVPESTFHLDEITQLLSALGRLR